MKINYEKLLDFSDVELVDNGSEVDEIIEYEEVLLEISNSLKKYRKAKKMTQRQMAKLLEMDQVMISKLESGNYNPTFKQLHKISRKLTNSSELFIRTLKNIIDNLNQLYKTEYNFKLRKSKFINNKKKVIYMDYKTPISGGMYNGEECTSIISIAG